MNEWVDDALNANAIQDINDSYDVQEEQPLGNINNNSDAATDSVAPKQPPAEKRKSARREKTKEGKLSGKTFILDGEFQILRGESESK